MNTRLKELRTYLKLSQKDLGDKISLSSDMISLLETGKRSFTERVIKDICRECNVSKEWFLNGDGEMFIDEIERSNMESNDIDEFQLKFSEKLKNFRKNKLMTQVEFSKIYNLPRTTIAELESGRKDPTLKMIYKIAEATNTELSYWLEPNKNSKQSDFKCLDAVILKLLKNEMIDKEGNLSEEAKEIILNIVEIEIKLSYL